MEEVTQLYICPTYKTECSHRISRQPMISVRIGSVECCAVLDTSAEASLVIAAVLEKYGWKPETEPQSAMELVTSPGSEISSQALQSLNFASVSTVRANHTDLLWLKRLSFHATSFWVWISLRSTELY